MKLVLPLICALTISTISYSQNSLSDSATVFSADSINLSNSKKLSTHSRLVRYDSAYIWNDRRSLSEISNEFEGAYVHYFNNFGRNTINFKGYSEKFTGIYIDGIQINDIYFGGFDDEFVSVNDISSIEVISSVSSFLYGMNSESGTINIISKDVVRPKPFSQLRYTQDRYNSLGADLFFSLPVTKKFNLNMGVTKQSSDGRYQNSQFDTWKGRMRLNYFASNKILVNGFFYYNRIERGLNEGLFRNEDLAELADDEAIVNNPYSNEFYEQFTFGASASGRLFGKNALTNLKYYSYNTLREYNNNIADSSLVYSGFGASENFHYIRNAFQLTQDAEFRLSRSYEMNLLFGVLAYSDVFDKQVSYIKQRVQFSVKAGVTNPYFDFSVFANNPLNGINLDKLNIGSEIYIRPIPGNNLMLEAYAGVNHTTNPVRSYDPYEIEKTYSEYSLSVGYKDAIRFKQTYYSNDSEGSEELILLAYDVNSYGLISALNANAFNVFAEVRYQYGNTSAFPNHLLSFDLSYRNLLFADKLNLHTGFRGTYLRRENSDPVYDQKKNEFISSAGTLLEDEFEMSFYLGARIGRANVNLTVGNIFNNFFYTTYIYPRDDRGGFLNSISRFTIVWDFID